VARIQRLRVGLSLNWAAIGLVLDLLDRIEVLERALRARPGGPAPPPRSDDRLWISTV
jgi:chaperone modulatory protein CbpM